VRIADACARLAGAGVRVSLFIDADARQVAAAAAAGAPCIEIHTGRFADAADGRSRERELARRGEAVRLGVAAGMQVNAGHGLHYHNVTTIAAIPEVRELNIGHAIIARAVFTGLAAAVAEMKRLMYEARY
jgi:pyridoxine 5-phosphate synthase